MQRRRLPGTDLELSVVGMGCWALGGTWWGPVTARSERLATVAEALDAGINWFDTAPLYGHGEADRVLVEALGARRHDVVLATKVGVRTEGVEHAESDLRPEHVVADAEASLRRLGVHRLDLLQIHWPCDHGTPLEDTFAALERLRDRGDVGWYGVCNYDAEGLRACRVAGAPVSLQTPYSLVRRELEGELWQAASGLGLLAYEPLCRGLLTDRWSAPNTPAPAFPESDQRSWDDRFQGAAFRHLQRMVVDLGRAAARLGVPVASLAAGWVASRPGVTAAIVGLRRPHHVREVAAVPDLLDRSTVWKVVEGIVQVHGPV